MSKPPYCYQINPNTNRSMIQICISKQYEVRLGSCQLRIANLPFSASVELSASCYTNEITVSSSEVTRSAAHVFVSIYIIVLLWVLSLGRYISFILGILSHISLVSRTLSVILVTGGSIYIVLFLFKFYDNCGLESKSPFRSSIISNFFQLWFFFVYSSS